MKLRMSKFKELTNVVIMFVILLLLSSCGDNVESKAETRTAKINSVETNSKETELKDEPNENIESTTESHKTQSINPPEIDSTLETALFFEDPVVEERVKIALNIENRPLYPSDLEEIKCMRIDTDYGTGYEFSFDSYNYGDDITTFVWHKLYLLWDREDDDWDNINNIANWNDIKHFTNLEYLEMNTSDVVLNYMQLKFDNLEPIGYLKNLKYFTFHKSTFTDLSPIGNCKKLEYLYIPGVEVTNLDALRGLIELKEFKLHTLYDRPIEKQLSDISGLDECTKMEKLDLSANAIEDISALSQMKQLKELDLSMNKIKDYSPLEDAGNFMTLNLEDTDFEDVSFQRGFKNVDTLNLYGADGVNLQDVSTLINIKRLDLSNTELTDITPLSYMFQLIELDLNYNEISDFTPLGSLINLETLAINSNPVETLLDFKELNNLKKLYIDKEYHGLITNIDASKTDVFY